jgi:hypothetical protein
MYIARILQPPVVKYRGQGCSEVAEQVSVGRWTIRNRFYATPTIKIWGMIYFGPKPDNRISLILQQFKQQLPPVSNHIVFSILMASIYRYFLSLDISKIWY